MLSRQICSEDPTIGTTMLSRNIGIQVITLDIFITSR
jgi:hypothetical protein